MRRVQETEFGKDHWSLLAYVETRCVDGVQGLAQLERNRMRCNPKSHPLLAARAPWKAEYGSRLRGFFAFPDRADAQKAAAAGLLLLDHDDWDCLDDLQAAGLLEIQSLANPCVQLTARGIAVSASLRAHKMAGGVFANFEPSACPRNQEPCAHASALQDASLATG